MSERWQGNLSHPLNKELEKLNKRSNINLLDQLTGDRRLKITQLLKDLYPEVHGFDQIGLSRITEKSILGAEAVKQYPKLMVLEKPGFGKMTFLKYLPIRCNSGDLLGNFALILLPSEIYRS